MIKIRDYYFVAVVAFVFFGSCVSMDKMVYVQSPEEIPSEMVYDAREVDNLIRSGDEIYIRISSADEAPTSFSSENQRGIYDPTLLSYTVSPAGTINLPYIGSIEISELTLEQAREKITESLSEYLFMPDVYMKFVNTKVTVLGEVNRPGVYVFNDKNISVFQAIGYANDIAEFGNREKVLIIREEGGERKKHFVDLTNDDILSSEYYILKPDDIVYVQPLKRKRWGITTVPYNLVLTIISTGLFVYTVVSSN